MKHFSFILMILMLLSCQDGKNSLKSELELNLEQS